MIGGGYVGLVSGACFAEFGTDVTIVETDPRKLSALRDGRMPIYEPGLEQLVAENVKAGRLSFTSELAAAVDAKAREVLGSVGQVGDTRLLLMAALLLADEHHAALGGLGAAPIAKEAARTRPESPNSDTQKAAETMELAAKKVEEIAARLAAA